MNNPIFIVGLPRTGSTLLLNVFSRNDSLCRLEEMHYLTPFRKDFRHFLKHYAGDLRKDENILKMVDMLFVKPRIQGIKKGGFWINDLERVEASTYKQYLIRELLESDRTVESIFKSITKAYCECTGKSRLLIKFPMYPCFIPKLIKWYPDCKIVHLVRDPRAIAVSKKNDPGGTQKLFKKYPFMKIFAPAIRMVIVKFVIVQYNWSSRLHKHYSKYKNYMVIKYEDLLINPELTIDALCKHTDIDYHKDMLLPKKGQRSSITNERKEGFDKSAAFRWKEKMGTFETSWVTLLTSRSMKRFAYDPDSY